MSVTNHAQIFEGVCEGELRAIIKERGQIAGVRVEAHYLRLLCIERKEKNYVGSETTPYIDIGKGDTLARRAVSLLHQGE